MRLPPPSLTSSVASFGAGSSSLRPPVPWLSVAARTAAEELKAPVPLGHSVSSSKEIETSPVPGLIISIRQHPALAHTPASRRKSAPSEMSLALNHMRPSQDSSSLAFRLADYYSRGASGSGGSGAAAAASAGIAASVAGDNNGGGTGAAAAGVRIGAAVDEPGLAFLVEAGPLDYSSRSREESGASVAAKDLVDALAPFARGVEGGRRGIIDLQQTPAGGGMLAAALPSVSSSASLSRQANRSIGVGAEAGSAKKLPRTLGDADRAERLERGEYESGGGSSGLHSNANVITQSSTTVIVPGIRLRAAAVAAAAASSSLDAEATSVVAAGQLVPAAFLPQAPQPQPDVDSGGGVLAARGAAGAEALDAALEAQTAAAGAAADVAESGAGVMAAVAENVREMSETVMGLNVDMIEPGQGGYGWVKTPSRHVRTRLYFTSESHVHALVNTLKNWSIVAPSDKPGGGANKYDGAKIDAA
jgi:hypothetical protein